MGIPQVQRGAERGLGYEEETEPRGGTTMASNTHINELLKAEEQAQNTITQARKDGSSSPGEGRGRPRGSGLQAAARGSVPGDASAGRCRHTGRSDASEPGDRQGHQRDEAKGSAEEPAGGEHPRGPRQENVRGW